MSGVTKWRWSFPGFGTSIYNFKDKEECVKNYVMYMLARTQSMFKYNGLPDTIPQRSLELYLQTVGHCGIIDYKGNLYAVTGGLGGEPDAYYMPTIYTVANPYLKFDANLKIGEDTVIIPNDSLYLGLMPIMERYASALMENDITFFIHDINSRIVSLLSSSDDNTAKGAKLIIDNIVKGELGVIVESKTLEGLDRGIKSQPFGNSGSVRFTDLIEYQQYLKAGWLNELGIDASYNMKREALNSAESALNKDVLYPLIDDMLNMRQQALEKVNEMFGTNITVELASVWEVNEAEEQAEIEALENNEDPSDPSSAEAEAEATDETEGKEKDDNETEQDET